MSRSRRAITATAAVLAAVAGAAVSGPPAAQPTSASRLPDKAVVRSWARLDAAGRQAGHASWRVTTAGGNCCEVLVAATSTGRLVEFGGTYPAYSDDRGSTWTEVVPVLPSTSRLPSAGPRRVAAGGEGTIVMAPGGDIVGVGWDLYTGDRLHAFLYDASERTWYAQESPVHEPFYDRQWVAVAKGPFTVAGRTVPWVSLVLSNGSRRIVLMSLDGLTYVAPTSRDLDALRGAPIEQALPVRRDAELDYLQEHSSTGLVSLPGGGALSLDRSLTSSCTMQLLRPDATWTCFRLPGARIEGRLHIDSRGWLHDVSVVADEVRYRISTDGGRSWRGSTLTVPLGLRVESWDFKAHGRLALSAIAVHAKKASGHHQDLVLRVDTRAPTARLVDALLVGDGNLAMTSGLDVEAVVEGTKSDRFDFASVAILPDGKIAVGFADRRYDDPALAVLL